MLLADLWRCQTCRLGAVYAALKAASRYRKRLG